MSFGLKWSWPQSSKYWSLILRLARCSPLISTCLFYQTSWQFPNTKRTPGCRYAMNDIGLPFLGQHSFGPLPLGKFMTAVELRLHIVWWTGRSQTKRKPTPPQQLLLPRHSIVSKVVRQNNPHFLTDSVCCSFCQCTTVTLKKQTSRLFQLFGKSILVVCAVWVHIYKLDTPTIKPVGV